MIYSFLNTILIPISLIVWLIATPVNLVSAHRNIEPFQYLQIVAKAETRVSNSFNQSHKPIRQPKKGNCSCPYDTDKTGKTCGGRSAYSRPNGDRPVCYQDD